MCTQDGPGRASDSINRRHLLVTIGGATVGVVLLADPGPPPRLVASSTPLPGATRPTILSCAGWDARDPSQAVNELPNRPNKIIVHHTATANHETDPLTLTQLAKSIQDFHMDHNGWIDSGHHFLVNRAGLIAEGRHRSLETLPAGRHLIEGTHCRDQNTQALGIENEGTYSKVDPPDALLAALRRLCAYACVSYRIAPARIGGHRDYGDTACPGDRLYALLPSLRSGVAGLLAGSRTALPVTSPPTWPLLRAGDRGPAVLAAQHLMRAAGVAGVPADGAFGPTTATGVVAFQRAHSLDLTGMIGASSWPLLAVPVRPGQGGEAEDAVRALLPPAQAARPRWWEPGAPTVVQGVAWQRLLGTG